MILGWFPPQPAKRKRTKLRELCAVPFKVFRLPDTVVVAWAITADRHASANARMRFIGIQFSEKRIFKT